jgi:ribonuclease HI
MSELKIDGIILFTDGSSIPNPGDGGWGFHGYAYSNEAPKKGNGNTDYYVTNLGYVEKTMLDAFRKGLDPFEDIDFSIMKEGTESILDEHMTAKEITPIYYLDHFGPSPIDPVKGASTNNIGECMALYKALEFCHKENIKDIQIYADSRYALDGWTKALHVWAKNNWTRLDGNPIQNKEIWQNHWELKKRMGEFDITLKWIPGHSIFLGNQLADMNANLGRCMTVAGRKDSIEQRSPAQGYWRDGEVDKHPLVCHQKLFFNGDSQFHEPGIYYMGAIDKDLGLFGKRLSDTSYSVLQLKEPIESLEKLRKLHSELGENKNEMVVGHLSSFFRPRTYSQFMEYGDFCFSKPHDYINNIQSVDKQLVTEVIDPPKKALEAVMAINNVAQWMNDWLEKRPGHQRFSETDLTPHLYETSIVQKKNKDVVVTKLKASIKPGVASIEVDANYRDSSRSEITLPTILTFGIDLADRNGLKRIEELSPKVTLLSWEESPGVFRYFSVIQANDDVGAYCGYYSNTRLKKTKKKSK